MNAQRRVDAGVELGEEADEMGGVVAGHVLAADLAGVDVEGGDEAGRAVTAVLELDPFRPTPPRPAGPVFSGPAPHPPLPLPPPPPHPYIRAQTHPPPPPR